MVVEIISVGTELLLGNIVNTNAAYLSQQCAQLGLACYFQMVVGDNQERLIKVLSRALKNADVVILSGGLGPTKDDLTKEAVAELTGRSMVMDEPSKEVIRDFFDRKKLEITENNWHQAMVPQGSIVVKNRNGLAPGVILKEGKKHIILLPGPPEELKRMFAEEVKPYLETLVDTVICSKMIKICGIGESKVEMMIADLLEQQSNPTIAPYAKTGEVHLRVTARAETEKKAKKLMKPLVDELKKRFEKAIFATKEAVTLEQAVVELLEARKMTVATAESCTGGMLASRLINVAGVSKTFMLGEITYSNKAKRKVLNVKKSSLKQYGAVSEQVAMEMARGLRKHSKADVAVSITGIAGPEGGTADKPVGLVYIACDICGKVAVQRYYFNGDREKVRQNTTAAALVFVRKCILEY